MFTQNFLQALSLRRNIPCLLDGEENDVKRIIRCIQDDSSCIFQQSKGSIDTATVHAHTAYVSCEDSYDKRMLVKDYIKQYTSDIEVVLQMCNMQEKYVTRMKDLTQKERVLLQLNIHRLRKPFLWIFHGMWDQQEEEIQQLVRQAMQEYMQDYGCYVIGFYSTKSLFYLCDTYSFDEEGSPLYSNYLEEDVPFYTTTLPTPRHKKHSFMSGVRLTVYSIFVFFLTILCFVSSFSYYMLKTSFDKEEVFLEEASQYPVLVGFCIAGETTNQIDSNCAPRNNGQIQEIIKRKAGKDIAFLPFHRAFVDLSGDSYFVKANGEHFNNIDFAYESSLQVSTYNKDAPTTLGIVEEKFREEGVYITKQFALTFFKTTDLEGYELHAKINIPIYSHPDKYIGAEGEIINRDNFGTPIYAVYDVVLPIAGITNSFFFTDLKIEQSFYEYLQEEVGYGKPYSENQNVELNGFERPLKNNDDLEIFYPNTYIVLAESRKDASYLKTAFMPSEFEIASEATYSGTLYTTNEYKEYVKNSNVEAKALLKPYIMISLLGLCFIFVCECYAKLHSYKNKLTMKSLVQKGLLYYGISLVVSLFVITITNSIANQSYMNLDLWFSSIFLNSNYNNDIFVLLNMFLALSQITWNALVYSFLFVVPAALMTLYALPLWFVNLKHHFRK